MKKKLFQVFYLVLLAFLICSCGSESENGTIDGDLDIESEQDLEQVENNENAQVEISNFSVVENTANSLSFFAEWSTDIDSATRLDVICGTDYQESFTSDSASKSHQVFVMGLIPETQCQFTAIAKDNAGLTKTSVKTVNVTLPDFFPAINLVKVDLNKMQRGWTLVNLVNSHDNKPMSVAMIDEQGRYRWYHRVETTSTGADNDVRTVENGVLIGGTDGAIHPQIISWEGKQLWKIQLDMHHDFRPINNGAQYFYLSSVDICESPKWDNADNLSDSVHIWDVEQNKPVWQWVLCEHYTPKEIVIDWSHLNSVEAFPNENAILISSREQHALFKVNMDNEEIVWKLGLDGDFQMKDEDLFYRQHATEIQQNGNILLFDNGDDRQPNVREYSRAIEIAYDETNMTAEVVWEYRHNPDIFAPVWSDADKMANGNVLVTFGKEYETTSLVEVTAEDTAEVVWEAQPANGWGVYRSERVIDPIKGYIVKIDN